MEGQPRVHRPVRLPSGGEPLTVVSACAFMASCLRAGLDMTAALSATAAAWGGSDAAAMSAVSEALRQGQQWETAWTLCPPHLIALDRALRPTWQRGASPVGSLEALADAELARGRAAAVAASAELGVRLTLPLTVCLLPAFVVSGIVPLLVAIGSGVLSDVMPVVASITP